MEQEKSGSHHSEKPDEGYISSDGDVHWSFVVNASFGHSANHNVELTPESVDAVFDSVSVATTFKGELTKHGIIFCSMSEAIQKHPELVKKYLGTVIPTTDHFFATLNSAVFTDGSFAYIPEGVRCPMELSTYFRINASNTCLLYTSPSPRDS